MTRWVLLLLCLIPLPAHAATKYVSPSGSAIWSACTTSGTPCSVATAMSNATAGDVVRFLSGDYFPPNGTSDPQLPSWYPANDGTAGNYITLISDVRHGAVIHSAANQGVGTNHTGFGCYISDYIIFDGFTIDSDRETGDEVKHPFLLDSCRNIIVQYMSFPTGWEHSDHTNGASIGVYGTSGAWEGSDIIIRYNDVTGPTNDLTPTEAVVNACGIYVFEVNGIEIHNNTVHDANNGICWKTSTQNIEVHHNYLYNINRIAFFPTPEINNPLVFYVHHNVVRNANILMFAEDPPAGGGTYSGLRIWNNTFYNDASHPLGVAYVAPSGSANVSGIALGQDAGAQTARSVQFYNNIVAVSTTSRGWEINDDVTSDAMLGSPFNYNVYYISSGTLRYIYNGTNTTSFTTYQTAINDDGEEANSSTSNPVFLNGSGNLNQVNDFKLNPSTSPFLTNGYGSVERGAFEGGGCVGAVCSVASGSPGGMDVKRENGMQLVKH